MLRAKIYVNSDEIDDIQIVNQGKKNKKGDTLYKVKDDIKDYYVYHKRENGWEALLMQVLTVKALEGKPKLKYRIEE